VHPVDAAEPEYQAIVLGLASRHTSPRTTSLTWAGMSWMRPMTCWSQEPYSRTARSPTRAGKAPANFPVRHAQAREGPVMPKCCAGASQVDEGSPTVDPEMQHSIGISRYRHSFGRSFGCMRDTAAARLGAEMFAIGLEPAAEPIQLVVFVDLVRPLVKIAVQRDFVAVFEQQVDLRRVLLDDPAGNEEGQVQIAARELLDEARNRDQRVVARPGLCRDQNCLRSVDCTS
jgi:hypothetical protein